MIFALVSLAIFRHFDTFLGWVVKIMNKDQLRPAEAEAGAELGNIRKQEGAELCQAQPAKHKLFGSNGAIFLV